MSGSIVALAGGVGGAKLAQGLLLALPPGELTVIVNTADDFDLYGLRICPDVDTVLYTLAGLANPATGWGLAGDTFHALEAITRLGRDPWFKLGDQDLATHILRTERLRAGATLTEVTAELATALGIPARLLPMTDDPVATKVDTPHGRLDFQDYFVARRQTDDVLGVVFEGIESARLPTGVGGARGRAGDARPRGLGLWRSRALHRSGRRVCSRCPGSSPRRPRRGARDPRPRHPDGDGRRRGPAAPGARTPRLWPRSTQNARQLADGDDGGRERGRQRVTVDGPVAEGIVALVPIRSLSAGKSRLSAALTPEAREALTRRMLRGVVRAALDSGAVGAVLLVSPDPAALALAVLEGPRVVPLLQDPHRPGLNAAISQGRDWATTRRAAALLVLFGDLPLLAPEDVGNLVRRDAPVVLAPDRHGTGTNALLLRLDRTTEGTEPFRFAFGPDSYSHHVDEAHRLDLEVATSLTSGTAFDLDTPDDLRLLVEGAQGALGAQGAQGAQVSDESLGILRGARS
jgi:2-phospho-L-lactate guanylyltransferase